jgi:hypothetical protein
MKHSDERVALQAVEFWTTVCEEEVELAAEANEVGAQCSILYDHILRVICLGC